MSTGMPRPLSATVIDVAVLVQRDRDVGRRGRSSPRRRSCRRFPRRGGAGPALPTPPMYMPGRLRTGSRPSRTVMSFAVYEDMPAAVNAERPQAFGFLARGVAWRRGPWRPRRRCPGRWPTAARQSAVGGRPAWRAHRRLSGTPDLRRIVGPRHVARPDAAVFFVLRSRERRLRLSAGRRGVGDARAHRLRCGSAERPLRRRRRTVVVSLIGSAALPASPPARRRRQLRAREHAHGAVAIALESERRLPCRRRAAGRRPRRKPYFRSSNPSCRSSRNCFAWRTYIGHRGAACLVTARTSRPACSSATPALRRSDPAQAWRVVCSPAP